MTEVEFAVSTMTEIEYEVRRMTKEDVPQALDVWRETGLQEGNHCPYSWLAVDREAVQVAVTDGGEVIGACSACVHHDDLAFVGFYCVREKYRRFSIGHSVWKACMDHVGSRNVCLNALPNQLEFYRDRAGFPIEELDWVSLVNETSSAVQHENLSDTSPQDVEIESFEDSHLQMIYDYDYKLIGYDRKLVLELNCKEEESRTFVATRDDACVGFGTVKISCQQAALVGPLYADNKEIAEVILKRLIQSLPQAKGFAMMTVSNNDAANELIRRINCPTSEECPRLYRTKKVDVDLGKVFGQFDLNFSPY